MKPILLILASILCSAGYAQNVGIGTTTPAASLEVKGFGNTTSTRALIVKNADNDTLVWVNDAGKTMLGGVGNFTHTLAVLNELNESYPQIGIIAHRATFDPAFPAGSTSRLSFFNKGSTANQYEIDAYTGSEPAKQYMQISYWPTFTSTGRRNLMHFKPNGNIGIGTDTVLARLQINHRGSVSNPALMIKDSASGILQFQNITGSGKFSLVNTLPASGAAINSYMDFVFNGNTLLTLRGDGNLGIGNVFPGDKLSVTGTINVTGEVQRSQTGTANMVPIAYGNITAGGGINTGGSTSNFTVSRFSAGVYIITITGESYIFSSYCTIVTPIIVSSAITCGTSSGSNSLQVYTFNAAGVATDSPFHFVTFKL
ncbi:MAG: hypothetical protein ABIX01_00905 [Chitinophagaceae bacterium]